MVILRRRYLAALMLCTVSLTGGFVILNGCLSPIYENKKVKSNWLLWHPIPLKAEETSAGKKPLGERVKEQHVLTLSPAADEVRPYYVFPELDFYVEVEQLTNCKDSHVIALTLQHAMRACLAEPSCTSLSWNSETRATQHCGFQHSVTPLQSSHQDLSRKSVVRFVKVSEAPSWVQNKLPQMCPEGLYLVHEILEGHCMVCPTGYCRVLHGSRLKSEYDDQEIQQLVRQMLSNIVHVTNARWAAYNPSLAVLQGIPYILYRSATTTSCPADPYSNVQQPLPEGTMHWSEVVVCPLNHKHVPATQDCKHIPWDASRIYIPRPFKHLANITGLHDGRLFSWRGQLHVLGYIMEDISTGDQYKHQSSMLLTSIRADLRDYDQGSLLECPDTSGNQKNWMPVVIGDELYVVVDLVPLYVARIEVDSHGRFICIQHQRELDEDDAASAALQAVLPQSTKLRGSTPFLPLSDGKLLGLAHHKTKPIYVHHLVTLSVRQEAGLHHFSVDWVSEAFRLPDPVGYTFYIQYASGLMLVDDTLYISYGLSDCYTALAEVTKFTERFQAWEQYGLGTQAIL